jgi:hypothetical protein
MGLVAYNRSGDDLAARGLYLDMPAWGHHVFAVDQLGPIRGERNGAGLTSEKESGRGGEHDIS